MTLATVTSFRTPEEAALDLELPLLGVLRDVPDAPGPVATASTEDDTVRRDAARVAERVLHSALLRDGCAGLLGDVPSGRRAQLATRLSAALAAERPVVLVDADLRHAHLSFDDRRRAQEGLVDVLRYGVRSPRVVAPTLIPGLALLPVGSRTVDLAGTFGAEAVPALLAELRRGGDLLIVNGPDLGDLDAAAPFLDEVGVWVLVVELGVSDAERTRALRDRFGRSSCVGILVLAGAEVPRETAPAGPEIARAVPPEAPAAAPAVAAVPAEPVEAWSEPELADEGPAPAPFDTASAPAPAQEREPSYVPDLEPVAAEAQAKTGGRRGGPLLLGVLGGALVLAFVLWGAGRVHLFGGRAAAPVTTVPAPAPSHPAPERTVPVQTAPEPSVQRAAELPAQGGAEPPAQTATEPGAQPPAGSPGAVGVPDVAVSPPTTAAATPPVPAAATPQAPLGDVVWGVHLSSVKTREGAVRELAANAGPGRAGFLHRTEIPDKGTWWRVYLGPYATRAEADRAAEELHRSGRDYAQVHRLRREEVEVVTGREDR